MIQLTLKIKESYYGFFLQFLRSLTYVEVEVKDTTAVNNKPNYDFSDLTGKLEWRGDAVTQQRTLREEW
jgi:hypothetical protein